MARTPGSSASGTRAWINARVANALRSPLAIILLGCAVFVVALVVLVVVPRQAQRGAPVPARAEQHPDTMLLLSDLRRLQHGVDSIERVIVAAGDSLVEARAATQDTLPVAMRMRRDSLAANLALLNRLLLRVENAPLPASYRALAQAPAMRRNARVATLLDSLAIVERERDQFGASGGVDPIFVALTERVASIGRALGDIAERERAKLRDDLAAIRQLQPRRDTLPASILRSIASVQRDSARQGVDSAQESLTRARGVHAASDLAAEQRRRAANISVPPVAMLIASALLGIVAGFGGALGRELRHPRIATVEEAEQTAGVRVLAVVDSPARAAHEQETRLAFPLIQVNADSFRRLYLHVTGAGATLAMVTVTGDDTSITAVVSANIAASAGHEGRGTLLIDADVANSPIAAILGASESPGITDIASGDASWPEALQALTLAHDFSLDLIPAGPRGSSDLTDEEAERVRRDLARMVRRYDLMVLNAPLSHVLRGASNMLPAPDVILCVQLAHTRIGVLAEMVRALRAAGTRVNGLVIWNVEDPGIPSPRAAGERKRRRQSVPPAPSGP